MMRDIDNLTSSLKEMTKDRDEWKVEAENWKTNCETCEADNHRLQKRVDELEAEIATLRSSADVERVAERIAKEFLHHPHSYLVEHDQDSGSFEPRRVATWNRKEVVSKILQALQGESKGEGR
jgi:chromosome segregation ATPase